jgi:hypothetical protein
MEELTRTEWLIARAIVNAAVCANAADCGTDKEKELSVDARKRIFKEVVANTSAWQRESLASLLSYDEQSGSGDTPCETKSEST